MITLDYSAEKRADLYRKAGFSFLFYFFSFFVIYVDLRVKKKKCCYHSPSAAIFRC